MQQLIMNELEPRTNVVATAYDESGVEKPGGRARIQTGAWTHRDAAVDIQLRISAWLKMRMDAISLGFKLMRGITRGRQNNM